MLTALLKIVKDETKRSGDLPTRDKIRRAALQRKIMTAPTLDRYLKLAIAKGFLQAEAPQPKQAFTPYRLFQVTAAGEAMLQAWRPETKKED